MEIICTRPGCTNPRNFFGDLDSEAKIRTVQQRYCQTCGMPLILADRYLPSKLLGQGGFGTAFLARDRYKPKMSWCVVKQFQPAANLDAQELAVAQNLFQREAIVLEELGHKHPQIPDLYAFFTPIVPNSQRTGEEQYFYLAQEFIDGQNLETELETKGKFSEAEVVEILTAMLKVLIFVHDHNTIHRDIKPSNIMRNKQGVLYLLDFGSVKQIAAGSNNQRRSTGIYSMGFAPPEQMSGAEVYPSTDLYALAVTCISLLTGEAVEELYDSFNYSWNWRGYAPQTSDRLTDILNKMLQSTPAQRFQSAVEVLAALAVNKPITTSTSTTKSANNAGKKKSPNSPIVSTISISPNSSSTPVPTANPIPPTPAVPSSPPIHRSIPSFSLLEVLSSAAFTGFEGGLLYMGLTSALSVSGISLGIFGMTMGGLIFALNRRMIEKIDLLIFAGVTITLVLFVPGLQGTLGIQSILVIAVISAAGAIAITAFFRLIYQLLIRLL
jgi:serine/threonine protein kinase